MGRGGLGLALTLLLAAPAPGYATADGSAAPRFVGPSRAVLAAAVDDTAGMPMLVAMVHLANQWIGRDYSAFPLDRGPREELRLDLTRFDAALFVEQLLAAVHSRQPEGSLTPPQRFAAHVRRLRYAGGRVTFCSRQHYFSRWAEAAERQGYLVNLTPHLPGARRRTQALRFVSAHAALYEPLHDPQQRRCVEALERDLTVEQAYLPLAALGQALPSLRSGDLYALVSEAEGIDVSDAGVLDLRDGRLAAIHAEPGDGVRRTPDLAAHAATLPEVIGIAFYRPVPRSEPGGGP